MLHREESEKAHEKWPKTGVFRAPHGGWIVVGGDRYKSVRSIARQIEKARGDICERSFFTVSLPQEKLETL